MGNGPALALALPRYSACLLFGSADSDASSVNPQPCWPGLLLGEAWARHVGLGWDPTPAQTPAAPSSMALCRSVLVPPSAPTLVPCPIVAQGHDSGSLLEAFGSGDAVSGRHVLHASARPFCRCANPGQLFP